jgi:hypothetical protein
VTLTGGLGCTVLLRRSGWNRRWRRGRRRGRGRGTRVVGSFSGWSGSCPLGCDGCRSRRGGRRSRSHWCRSELEYWCSRNRCGRLRARRGLRAGTQKDRDLLHDRPHLRSDNSFQYAITDRLQIGEDHADADQVTLRCAYRQEDGNAAILQSRLVARQRAIVGQSIHGLENEVVLIRSERPLTEPQDIGLFVPKRDGVETQRRQSRP